MKTESIRIKIALPVTLYQQVDKLSLIIGISKARLIAMIVTDCTIDKRIVIDEESSHIRIKHKQYVNITLSNEIHSKIEKIVENTPHYSITKYVIDCIKCQIEDFSEILLFQNMNFNIRKRITRSNKAMQSYSKEMKEKYTLYVPLEEYIRSIEMLSGIKSGYIKKYYLAKQINSVISEYGDDEKRYFSNALEFNEN